MKCILALYFRLFLISDQVLLLVIGIMTVFRQGRTLLDQGYPNFDQKKTRFLRKLWLYLQNGKVNFYEFLAQNTFDHKQKNGKKMFKIFFHFREISIFEKLMFSQKWIKFLNNYFAILLFMAKSVLCQKIIKIDLTILEI